MAIMRAEFDHIPVLLGMIIDLPFPWGVRWGLSWSCNHGGTRYFLDSSQHNQGLQRPGIKTKTINASSFTNWVCATLFSFPCDSAPACSLGMGVAATLGRVEPRDKIW